jgi:ubiquinone/menaquinone biosynthesis C-methylase UbiE
VQRIIVVLSTEAFDKVQVVSNRQSILADRQRSALSSIYRASDAGRNFDQRWLLPAEAMILLRYRDDFKNKRVLDVGVGTGRTTPYLASLAAEYVGIDYSDVMLGEARSRHPSQQFKNVDMRHMPTFADSSFDVIFAPSAVLDALSHADRLRAFSEIARVLTDDGLFIYSAHNLACREWTTRHPIEFSKNPVTLAMNGVRWICEEGRRRNLRRYESVDDGGFAIVNDAAFGWRALHYYSTKQGQLKQLTEVGFRFLECLSMDGRPSTEEVRLDLDFKLHYVCRRNSRTSLNYA